MEPAAYDELNQLEGDHWWYRGMRDITARLLRAALPRQSGLEILDAGCGAGGNLDALAAFGRVWGFDYSPLALAYAAQRHSGQLLRASVEALPYAAASFDLVTSFDVLVCAEVADDLRALREFARVTRPGGHVLVRLAALEALRGPHDTVVHGARRYTAAGLRERLALAGLTPVRVTYANSLLLAPIYAARRLQSASVAQGAAPQSDVKAAPGPLNDLLAGLLGLEARWIGGGRGLPLGVSVLALAVKRGQM